MKDINATNIENSGKFILGNNLDTGTSGECIISNGANNPASWGTPVGSVVGPLTSGTNVNFTSGNPTWDGSVADTINSTFTDTTYQGGANITIDTTTNPDTINLNSVLTGMTGITYTGAGTNLTGGGGAGDETFCTYLDLTSGTNIFPPNIPVLPSNVYETSPGVYAMAFSQGIWVPNDDSSYYNYAIEDDFTSYLVAGRGKVLSTSLELQGFIHIPNGWRATKIFVDVRGSTGYQVSQTIIMYEVKTWSASNPVSGTYNYLGGSTTNNEYTLTATMDGQIDNAMWVEVNMTSTANYIAGGYVVLTKI